MRRLVIACALASGVASAASAQVVHDVLRQTNAFRQSQSREAVMANAALTAAAQAFAELMARTDRYGHDVDGHQPNDRAIAQGYDYCVILENIAFRYRSPEFTAHELATSLVDGWERSPEHRRNLLDSDVRETGIGVAKSAKSGRWYAVQMFGSPKASQIRFQIVNGSSTTVRYRIGDRAFALAPGYTQTHEQCRASTVTLAMSGEQPPTSITPRAGERYELRQDAAGRWTYTRGPEIR